MASTDINYTIHRIPVTMHVRFSRMFRLRWWLTLRLLLLAAWVSGWRMEVEGPDDA